MATPDATPAPGGQGGAATAADPGQGTRLRRAERYEALVQAAASLVAERDVDSVSMKSVASRAHVSRPLVYKYFADRHELLAAVYRREAVAMDTEIVRAVEAADGFEDILRTMIRGILAGAASRGRTFTTLRRAGARDANLRRQQRERDRRTIRYLARRAMEEFELPRHEAQAAIAILLAGIESILILWAADPTSKRARFLEELYVQLVFGGLHSVATARSPARA
jgi:AcrR family transcriptional regulator